MSRGHRSVMETAVGRNFHEVKSLGSLGKPWDEKRRKKKTSIYSPFAHCWSLSPSF